MARGEVGSVSLWIFLSFLFFLEKKKKKKKTEIKMGGFWGICVS